MTIRYIVSSRDPDATPPEAFAAVGETNGTTYDCPPLGAGVRREYMVNAYDTGTGLADENADARLTVRVADDGSDATTLPNAPSLVTATARPAGAAIVTWGYAPGGQGAAPSGFHVYYWPAAGSGDYSTPAATAGYRPDASASRSYSATLTGLTGGTAYGVAVRAFNATGEETNTAVVTLTAATAGPTAVTSLTAAATA